MQGAFYPINLSSNRDGAINAADLMDGHVHKIHHGEIHALGGRPGILSARYGGAGLDDAGRCRLMLNELDGVPEVRRGARYVAVAVIARPDGEARLRRLLLRVVRLARRHR